MCSVIGARERMGTHVTSADYVGASPEVSFPNREAHSSGVSWGAVLGGAFVTAALYLILLALGAGFGLSAVSPWSNVGITASTASDLAIVWLIIIAIIASAFGGYLTGRLRTKWTLIHTDEVFFRDTANGFVAWAVALVASAAFLATTATFMSGSAAISGGVTQAGAASGNAATPVGSPVAYYADALFRSGRASDTGDAAAKAEAERILFRGIREHQMSNADQSYLASLVAARTGMSRADAEKRVSDVITEERESADAVRKATARLLLWTFVSLLIGALCASYAATIGGRQRDHVKTV